jgi:hypothetical protein
MPDSTEQIIQKMIEGIRRMISPNYNSSQQQEPELRISSAAKRHFELEIETLQNAPRNEGKLRELLKLKEKQNGEATHIEDTQRLVTEIGMLKVVLFLVCRKHQQ